jgi:hypothetical protein
MIDRIPVNRWGFQRIKIIPKSQFKIMAYFHNEIPVDLVLTSVCEPLKLDEMSKVINVNLLYPPLVDYW